jgi:hypothetical protein
LAQGRFFELNYITLKRAKLILIALMTAIICACFTWRSDAQGGAQKRVEIVPQGTPLAERFGPDDGMSFVIHFSGDTHGSLEPCG